MKKGNQHCAKKGRFVLGIMVLEDELGLGNQNDEICAIRKTVMD